MARISRYDFDISVSKEDKLIGTDSGGSTTKNFKLEDLTTFFSKQQEILGSKFSYTYKNITDYTKLEAGELTVNSPADTVNFSSITDVYIYKLNADNLSIEAYLNEIKTSDSAIAIFNNEDTTSFGVYKITSITTQITNVLRLQLTQVAKNGTVLNKNSVNLGIIPAVDAINTLAQTLAVGNTTGATKIEVNNTNSGIDFIDNAKARFGTSGDLEIYHADTFGSDQSWIRDVGTNDLILDTNGAQIALISDGVVNDGKMALFKKDGAVELYYDNNKKFETTNTGVTITGKISGITDPSAAQDAATKAYVDAGDLSLIDEDNMASNSATRPPSQQSVKAYVDDKTQTLEEVEDIVGNMVSSNTESGISVTYDDTGGKLNFNVTSTQLTTEEVQDIVGAMVSGNTETNISVTYDDTSGKLNFVSTDTDTNTQLSAEEVQDIIGAMVSSNTETNISVTYDDSNGKLNFVSTDTNTQLTTEEVQDIVGAMFSGNTETRIGVTYDDSDGTIDLVVDDMTADTQLSNEQVQDIVGAMFTGNTETNISATYQDADGTIDLVATGTTYGISAVDGDNTDEEKIRLTDGDGTTDDVVLEAGTGLSISRSSDKITFTNTVTDTNTFRTVTAGGNTLGSSETLAFTAGSNVTITENAGAVTIASTDTNTQLSQEQVEDFVGGMLDGTETGISVSYDDTDGNIDFVVSDTTVAGDSGSTGITPGDTLTIAGGTNVTTAMSGDTLTITSTDTNTQLSTEQVQDIVGAMFSGNTETRIAATYQDGDGTIDLVVDDMTANTDVDVSNANLLTRLAALESSGGAANENIVIGTDSDDTIVITGNLQVSGTTTTVNSTTVNLNDHNIVLDSGNSTSAVVDGAGITLEGGSGDDATFTYSTTGPQFEMKLGSAYEDLQIAGLKTSGIVSSGDVTIDAGASSTLNIYKDDAGNGKLSFYNDSTQQVFLLHDTADNFYIHAGSGSAMIISTNGATTLTLDTSNNATFAGNVSLADDKKLNVGTGNDMSIFHNGSNSFIEQTGTGDLYIQQATDDKDIIFRCDDGSGGLTTYMYLDGSYVGTRFPQNVQLDDNVELRLGTNQDLRLEHTGSHGTVRNYTGNLTIENTVDDADIIFKSDDGSGGTAEYFRLDGSGTVTYFSKGAQFADSVKAFFGTGGDLKLYHDGNNSFIQNTTGSLVIEQASGAIALRPVTGETGVLIVENAAVTLYYDNSAKLATTSTGISVTGNGVFSGSATIETGINLESGVLVIKNATDDSNGLRIFQDTSDASKIYNNYNGTLQLGVGNTTAITIDSSENTTFAGHIILPDSKEIRFGTGTDANIRHDGNNTKFSHTGSGGLYIGADTIGLQSGDHTTSFLTVTSSGATFTGNVSLTAGVLSITGDGSNAATLTESGAGLLTIATVDDFVVDAGGDITFDADGGDIRFKDAGTEFGRITQVSSNFFIQNPISDGDFYIQGNDGGSTINALYFDMSEGGNATFAGNVTASSGTGHFSNVNSSSYQLNGTYVMDSSRNLVNIAAITASGQATASSFSATGGFLNGSNGGIRIHTSGTKFFNVTAANAARDNIMDVGASDARFKDAYFGGAVNAGSFVKSGGTSSQYLMADGSVATSSFNGGTITNDLIIDNTGSGDRTLTISTTTGGDPTIIFNSDAANRSGLIRYQDNGTNIGRIEYVHNGDKLQLQAGSATSYTTQITNGCLTTKAADASNSILAQWQATNENNCATFRTTDSGYIFRIHAQNSGTIYVQNDDGSNYLKIPDSGSNEVSGDTTFVGNIRTGTSSLTANTNFDNLVIEGSAHTGITIFSGTSSDGGIYFGDSGANNLGQIKYLHGSNAMTFATNDGSASLTLDSGLNATFAGNVGIGTTSPGANLEISGVGGDGSPLLKLTGSASATFNWISSSLHSGLTSGESNIHLFGQHASTKNSGYIGYTHSGTSGDDSNRITLGMYGANHLVNILASGKVGIGTTTPNEKLVVGTTGGTQNIEISNSYIQSFNRSGSAGYAALGFYGSSYTFNVGDTTFAGAAIVQGDDKSFVAKAANGTINATMGAASSSNVTRGMITVRDAGVTKIVLNGNDNSYFNGGNVGIGTTSPQTTLEVDGASSAFNAHFGQGTDNQSGVFGGISLGYSEANTSYRKVGIVAKAIADGAARQDLHFLVDTVSDSGSAGIADSKMSIAATTGYVTINERLGVGTTSPDGKVHISDTSTQLILETPNTTNDIDFRWRENGTNKWNMRYQNSGNHLQFLNQTGSTLTQLSLNADGSSTFAGNVDIYSGGSSATLNIGRNSSERLTIYQDDNHTTLTADNDSDGDGTHNFILNRTFDGSGANNFIIQKGGTAQLTIDTNANATFAGTITSNGGAVTINNGGSVAAYFNGTGSSYTQGAIAIQSSNADTPEARGQGVFMFNQGKDSTWYMGTRYNNADEWQIGRVAGTSFDTAAATTANNFVKIDNTGATTFASNFHTTARAAVGTTPHATIKLDVLSTAADWAARIKNYTNSGYGLAVDCSGAASSTTYALAAYSAAGGGLFVRNDDKVGIGTTSPAGILTINGTGDAIRVESTNAGAGGAQLDLLHFTASPADEDTFAAINMGGYYTGTTSVYGAQVKSIWTDVSERHSRLEFTTCDTSLSTALTLAHDLKATFTGDLQAPRIGIGALNASFNLYNNGTTYFNGETTIDANLIMSQTNAEVNFTSGNGVIQTTTASTSLTFGVNGSEKMRIHSTGDVMIGGTNPTLYNSNADDLIIYEANDFSGITLAADNDEGSNIYFADGDDDNVGGITYNHTSNYMNFRVNGSEVIRINSDGYVGIGVTNPEGYNSHGRNLVVNSSGNTGISIISGSSSSGSLLFGDGTGGTAAYRGKIEYDHSNDVMEIRTAATVHALINSSGALTMLGDVVAFGSPSDKRLKENIKPIESALDKVSKLQGVTFDWKPSDSILEIKEDVGFIAQDVQKVMPELVRENKDGMLSMRHQGVAPILLEAIKELKAEIEELKKQIK